ncbi:MAG: hypothetical protein GWO23_23780 [Gammaproteobacteria bacterium]|nr:hypothetical protein [Gammaproteobacteria bacterium]
MEIYRILLCCFNNPCCFSRRSNPQRAGCRDSEIPRGNPVRAEVAFFVGISQETVGSKVLSMNLVIIPPGSQAEGHYHDGFESAVYLIEGRVKPVTARD